MSGGLQQLYGLVIVAANESAFGSRCTISSLQRPSWLPVVLPPQKSPRQWTRKLPCMPRYHPSSLAGQFGNTQTLEAIHQWTVLGVSLLALHGKFLTYEQVRENLVYAIDFAKRKAATSTLWRP
jgi:hypothetical protein